MVSNGANFCCQVVTIILVLYSTIFYRDSTVSLDPESAVLYVAWLSFSVFGLALTAGQAIMLNHLASISLGPFYGAIAVPSVTRCRFRCFCRCCRGHRCAGGVRQWRRATVATPGE